MQRLLQQFFDRSLWYVWGVLALVHLVAALTFGSVWAWIPLVVLGVFTFVVSLRSLPHGLALAFLEIFVGGHGHALTAELLGQSIGIRMLMFGAVMLAWLILVLRGRAVLRLVPQRDLPWAFLALAVVMGFVNGLFSNGFAPAFDDMNGYLTLLYVLPVASVVWTPENKRVLLKAFFAAAAWVSATSLLMLYAFSHLPAYGIYVLYRFVRDARLAEITLLSGPEWLVALLPGGPWFFRIFEQGQFIVVAFELVLLAATLFVWRKAALPRKLVWLHAFMLATIIVGQSRSFWLGFIGGLGVIGVAVLLERLPMREWLRMKVMAVGATVMAILALWLLIAVPLPPRPDLSDSPFYRGKDDDTRDLAVSSRWNLLPPLMEKIGEDPLWGSGFGTTVTYQSDDPRIVEMNGTGMWTTYRFEWGYQDIWLKMGLPGLLAVAWYLGMVIAAGARSIKEKREWRWLTIGLLAAVMALYVTHVFSPYLNHPIGLGFMVFVIPFLGWNRKEDAVLDPVPAKEANGVSALVRPQVGVAMAKSERSA